MAGCNAVLLVILTFFIPPLGALIVAGCGVDFLINILLTILGVFPGHIHAYYLEYVFYKRREAVDASQPVPDQAGGVYSKKVLTGGRKHAILQGPNTIPTGVPTGPAAA